MGEAKKRGMSVSLSDYTLGTPGQCFYIDEVINKYPECCGALLFSKQQTLVGGQVFQYTITNNILAVIAYKLEKGNIIFESNINLLKYSKKGIISFEVPEGEWKIIIVGYNKKADSVDPMNPLTGKGRV